MTIILGLVITFGIALGVYLSFFKSTNKNRRDPSDPIVISSSVALGLPSVSMPAVARMPVKKKEVSKAPRVTDPLLRYKRRYGICGRYSRRSRRSRQELARRALEHAIRSQNVERLQLLYAIGVR